jgi:hypothetical protein
MDLTLLGSAKAVISRALVPTETSSFASAMDAESGVVSHQYLTSGTLHEDVGDQTNIEISWRNVSSCGGLGIEPLGEEAAGFSGTRPDDFDHTIVEVMVNDYPSRVIRTSSPLPPGVRRYVYTAAMNRADHGGVVQANVLLRAIQIARGGRRRFVGGAVIGIPPSRVTEARVTGQTVGGAFLVKFTFDRAVDATDVVLANVLVGGAAATALTDSGADWLEFSFADALSATFWELAAGHGIEAEGGVPVQNGSLINLKTLIGTVGGGDGNNATFTFSHPITATGAVDTAFEADGLTPTSYVSAGATSVTFGYASPVTGSWEIAALPTEVSSPGRYIPFPQSGAMSGGEG